MKNFQIKFLQVKFHGGRIHNRSPLHEYLGIYGVLATPLSGGHNYNITITPRKLPTRIKTGKK